ncbi:hypothetical protein LTR66_011106 [Elasticomyces elasticus]|nr:hypothetical protein LTR66_011106 [Elasticomyces elasticus]
MIALALTLLSLLWLPSILAQYPPAAVYSNLLRSPLNGNITIAYKQPPPGTCTTVFPAQKQYTGYISLPPHTLAPVQQNYPINTFFWFVEARDSPETAPLTIWLQGGPGASSLFGLFGETGPCEVVQLADGTYGTQSRTFGWDRSSNVLFIDQPNQVGFSYDDLRNSSTVLLPPGLAPSRAGSVPAQQNPVLKAFMLNGTVSSGTTNSTANTTEIAARATWHFLQSWLAAFPTYNPGQRSNSTQIKPAGVHLFTESYGGIYGPAFATYFEKQNLRRSNGSLPRNQTIDIELSSLGIVNGMIDYATQASLNPKFAYMNTYATSIGSYTDYINGVGYTAQCMAATNACRNTANASDPEDYGGVAKVNELCSQLSAPGSSCNSLDQPFQRSGLNSYDIRVPNTTMPSQAYLEYLNTASVQAAIGARVNFTEQSDVVYAAFNSTGDEYRQNQLGDIASLIRRGVRVAMIYGDADYICNWFGGEAASLAVASNVSAAYSTGFHAAGYADIVVNSTYVGGAVRQYGNLSFSRVYDAGHQVPFYQPETAFTLFTRIITGVNLSTGQKIDPLTVFQSTGTLNSTHNNTMPSTTPKPTCWVRNAASCTQDQIMHIMAGEGVIKAGVWYSNINDYVAPASTVQAGTPGQLPQTSSTALTTSSGSVQPTGVYVATSTPRPTGAAAQRCTSLMLMSLAFLMAL